MGRKHKSNFISKNIILNFTNYDNKIFIFHVEIIYNILWLLEIIHIIQQYRQYNSYTMVDYLINFNLIALIRLTLLKIYNI